jgi:NAD+ synthase (glutamine-hydrolysing)
VSVRSSWSKNGSLPCALSRASNVAEVFESLAPRFAQYSRQQLGLWVERFFRLWCRNQWKRERYAPSFHLDDENLDPKTWCRFPILSGGYEREIAELRKMAAGS